jgi:hypothetical protein
MASYNCNSHADRDGLSRDNRELLRSGVQARVYASFDIQHKSRGGSATQKVPIPVHRNPCDFPFPIRT